MSKLPVKSSLKRLVFELNKQKNPQKGEFFKRFFKTGVGEYGEGDVFLGLTVPQQRNVAKKYLHLNLQDLGKLLDNTIHEYRLVSLLILVDKYRRGKAGEKEKIALFYIKNAKKINNWDLVDSSANKILGDYLLSRDKSILFKLAQSPNLWERRISVIATMPFFKNGFIAEATKIYEMHLRDKHDLIHKAVGWMLRELGKVDIKAEKSFLDKYAEIMPRTMLRYAIEKFPDGERKSYLAK